VQLFPPPHVPGVDWQVAGVTQSEFEQQALLAMQVAPHTFLPLGQSHVPL
jgi:hypothetical protein